MSSALGTINSALHFIDSGVMKGFVMIKNFCEFKVNISACYYSNLVRHSLCFNFVVVFCVFGILLHNMFL